jgi:hypothetical protein
MCLSFSVLAASDYGCGMRIKADRIIPALFAHLSVTTGGQLLNSFAMLQYTLLALLSLYASRISGSECRCIPGDSCWPSLSDWSSLNDTVQGQLIATIPLATPCHDPSYNSTECEILKDGWPYGQT